MVGNWENINEEATNFRNPLINEPRIFGGPHGLNTPVGIVRTSQAPPPLPPRIFNQTPYSGISNPGYMGGYGFGSYGGGYGGFGNSYNSYGGYGFGGGMYGSGYNRFGQYANPNDPENRFIQIAEESSRPAFQSIESLVCAVGNIASMLDSTFFAITSSFRAILGVAANFGRLRGVFAQFWSTFAIFRGLSWLYRKILYHLHLSNIDPTTAALREAFAAAEACGSPSTPSGCTPKSSPWPILAFLGFIVSAPYLIMKLLGTISTTALEETKNPKTWVNPIRGQATYNFQATNPQELSISSGQIVLVAPKEVQNTHKLMNTGWALASVDNITSGLIPINYIRGPQQIAVQEVAANSQLENIFQNSKQEEIISTPEKRLDDVVSSENISIPVSSEE